LEFNALAAASMGGRERGLQKEPDNQSHPAHAVQQSAGRSGRTPALPYPPDGKDILTIQDQEYQHLTDLHW
jgi:hypothetical protein